MLPSTSGSGAPPIVHIRPPKPFGGRANEDFKSWRLRLEHYFTLANTQEAQKQAIMLLHLEGIAYRTAEKLGAASNTLTYVASADILSDYFVPPETKNEARMQFAARDMEPNESNEVYARALRLLAAEAYPDFTKDALEELSIQRFIKGVRTPTTSQRIFLKDCKTLKEAVQYANLSEAAFQIHRSSLNTRARLVASTSTVAAPSEYDASKSRQAFRGKSFVRGRE
jgi:hypothetical protein